MPGNANPQALNRYSYTFNSPLNYIDPNGHDPWWCDSASNPNSCYAEYTPDDNGVIGGHQHNNGDHHNEGGGGEAGGACEQGNYSPHCPGWHFYRTTNMVCSAVLNCTAAQMMDYLYRFAYPSQDPNSPVYNNAKNWVWVGPIPLGQITTKVDGLMITNITEPDHLMYDGQVVRQAIQNSDGSWSIVTTGSGNNVQIPMVAAVGPSYVSPSGSFGSSDQVLNFDFSAINAALGPGAFNDLDQAMLNYIVENH